MAVDWSLDLPNGTRQVQELVIAKDFQEVHVSFERGEVGRQGTERCLFRTNFSGGRVVVLEILALGVNVMK